MCDRNPGDRNVDRIVIVFSHSGFPGLQSRSNPFFFYTPTWRGPTLFFFDGDTERIGLDSNTCKGFRGGVFFFSVFALGDPESDMRVC